MATQIVELDPNNNGDFSQSTILSQSELNDEMSDTHEELISTLGKNRIGGHQHQPSLNVNNSQSQRVSVTGLPPDHLTDAVEKMKLGSIDEEGSKCRSIPHQSSAAAPPSSDSIASQPNRKVQQSTGGSGNAQNNSNPISYAAERVIGNGSFGVVYQATVIETGETVAIKKVLQDRRFKNRELQIMSQLSHPCVIGLKHCFYSRGDKPDEVYLNLVMDFVPETVHRTLRNHTKANKLLPNTYLRIYMWQICRAVNYIHSAGVCHRDIKPQNLLQNPNTHETFLCDFGSAKQLVKGEPNVSYICSRYYRAPELVFEATEYTNSIDIWSVGCVMGELMLGQPLFPGESGVDQLIEIIKVLGTPSREEIHAMNPNHTQFRFPQIKPQSWQKVFRNKSDPLAIDLISKMLVYDPTKRIDPLAALSHPFFDELKMEGAKMPNGKEILPKLFEFTEAEIRQLREKNLFDSVVPQHWQQKFPHIQ